MDTTEDELSDVENQVINLNRDRQEMFSEAQFLLLAEGMDEEKEMHMPTTPQKFNLRLNYLILYYHRNFKKT